MPHLLPMERLGPLAGPAIAAIANLLLAVYLLLRPPRNAALRVVLPFALGSALWNLGTLLVLMAPDEATALRAARWVYYPGVIPLPPLFYLFVARFTGRKLGRTQLGLLLAPGVLAFAALFAGVYVRSFHRYAWGYYPSAADSPFHQVWLLYYGALYTLAVVDLLRRYRSDHDPYNRNQILFVLAALHIFAIPSITNVLPLFGIGTYPLGNLSDIPFFGALFWILSRYRLIEFPRFLGRMTFRAFLALIAIALHLTILGLLAPRLAGFLSPEDAWAAAATIATLVAVSAFAVGLRLLAPQIGRRFFRRATPGVDLLDWGDALASEDPRRIAEQVFGRLHETAGVLSGAVLRWDDTTARARVEAAFGPDSEDLRGKILPFPESAAENLVSTRLSLVASELRAGGTSVPEAARPALLAVFEELDGSLLLPFILRDRLRGALVLGPRAGDGMYDSEDIRSLRLLAEQTAVALEHARLYTRLAESNASLRRASDELAELNRSLEQKVESRTKELESANVRIRSADRLKSQFLANMSHELRTPLNSIIGFSEILLERLGDLPPKHLRFLQNIRGSGQHLLGLINDLLDLSKIEAGKMELFREKFDPVFVVDGVRSVMRGVTDARSIRIEIDAPKDLPAVIADPVKFKQISYNLLSNAVKFSPDSSEVTVRLRAVTSLEGPGGVAALRMDVVDRGIGIAEEDRALIFDEFRQADSGTSRQFGGTGLGLALVRKFAEMQAGTVSVASEPGQGSTFTFLLPLTPPEGVKSGSPDDTGPRLPEGIVVPTVAGHDDRPVVLVVEDDPEAYDSIASELEAESFRCIRARSGEEALRRLEADIPDVVLLDIVLPGLDGWEVLRTARSKPETRETPIVIVTMVENRELGLALGADDFFLKPVPRDLLVERLRQLAPGSVTGQTVLLIDDDPGVHELFEADIREAGYRFLSARNGAEGLRFAKEERPSVIVLDLMMPGMTGFDVARELALDPETSSIPIIILTAKEITATDREQLGGRIAALFRKGMAPRTELVETVRALVRRRGVRRRDAIPTP